MTLYREYPHIVAQGLRSNWRRPLFLSNESIGVTFAMADDVFIAPGIVDKDGGISPS